MNTRNIIPLPWVRGGAVEQGPAGESKLGALAPAVRGGGGKIAVKLTRLRQKAAAGALLTAEEYDLVKRVKSGAKGESPKPRAGAVYGFNPPAMEVREQLQERSSCEIQVRAGRLKTGFFFNSPDKIFDAWKSFIEPAACYSPERENLVVFLLSARLEVIGWALIGIGSAKECIAEPRDILRPVIASGATAFILAHNHPSGKTDPSTADRGVTRRVREGCYFMGLNFIDHMIIGTEVEEVKPEGDWFSFKGANMM